MDKNHKEVWSSCLEVIKQHVSPQSFKTWFAPIIPVKLQNNSLTIQVPNQFFYEWLEENYISVLSKALKQNLGQSGKLEYQIRIENPVNKKPTKNSSEFQSIDIDSIKNPFVIPGLKPIKVDPQLSPDYTFENFIEGDCNKLARSAGIAISNNPGKTAFNPLVVYGDVGLGKTHLVHAIGNEALKQNPKKIVLYVTSERFGNQMIGAIKSNSIDDFLNFYQMVDVLIVDDIQFFSGKSKTLEIFFNIFNFLHQNKKQVILTSDRAPKDLEGMEDRLISRFKWGLTADLQIPDFETRRAILDHKIDIENIEMNNDVRDYIAFHISNNIREIEGVLISLVAQSTLNKRTIDVALAKEVIQNFVKKTSKELTIDSIANMVAEHFEMDVHKLQSKTRKRSVVIARQLSMYLAKNHTNNSLKSIGQNFGGRDHSTVIYSCKAVQDLMDTDTLFKDVVTKLEKKVILSMNY